MGGIASMAKDKEGESCGQEEGGQSTSGNTCACNALGMLGQPGGSGGFNSLACKKGISAAGMSLLPGAPGSGLLNNPAICSYGPCGGIVIVYVDPTTTTPSDFMEGGAFASVNVDASAQQAIPGSQN